MKMMASFQSIQAIQQDGDFQFDEDAAGRRASRLRTALSKPSGGTFESQKHPTVVHRTQKCGTSCEFNSRLGYFSTVEQRSIALETTAKGREKNGNRTRA